MPNTKKTLPNTKKEIDEVTNRSIRVKKSGDNFSPKNINSKNASIKNYRDVNIIKSGFNKSFQNINSPNAVNQYFKNVTINDNDKIYELLLLLLNKIQALEKTNEMLLKSFEQINILPSKRIKEKVIANK